MNLTTQTPVEIDTELAAIYSDIYRAQAAVTGAERRVADMAKHAEMIARRERFAINYSPEQVAAAEAKLDTARDELVEQRARTFPYDAEYDRRGGWTRAFLVVTNGTGHVHRSMRCSTCYPTTEFAWLPEMSGSDESEIVEAAGERACTICYPSAPVETLSRPTRLFSKTEIEKQAARDEREAKRAAKAAKLITAPDGTELRDGMGYPIKAEITAEREAVSERASLINGWTGYRTDEAVATVERILDALAAKRGTTVDEQRELVEAKAIAKARRDAR